jgi:hypothetical protein
MTISLDIAMLGILWPFNGVFPKRIGLFLDGMQIIKVEVYLCGLSDATVICVLQGCVSDWDSWSHLRYKTFYLLVQFLPFSFSSFSAC